MTAGTGPQMTVHGNTPGGCSWAPGGVPTSDWLDLGYERGRISQTALDIPRGSGGHRLPKVGFVGLAPSGNADQ